MTELSPNELGIALSVGTALLAVLLREIVKRKEEQ